MPEHEALADDLALLEDAVRAAGDLALAHFRDRSAGWFKSDGTPVSDADLAVNRLLADRLLAARPAYGWLSEETLDDVASRRAERTFIVDPIDGTRAFLSGTEEWCIGVAILFHGRPVAAAILQPTTGTLYSAAAAMGARRNDRPIRVSDRRELAGAHLIAHAGLRRPERWAVPWPEVDWHDLRHAAKALPGGRRHRRRHGRIGQQKRLGCRSGRPDRAGIGRHGDRSRGDPLHYGGESLVQNGVVAGGPSLMERMIPLARGYRS